MSDYLDEHPEKVKNAGYYRRELKLVQTKLAEKNKEIDTLHAENEALKASIEQKDEEIARLKDELLETQNRCVVWASTKGTILAMYENTKAELSACRQRESLLRELVGIAPMAQQIRENGK